MKKILIPIHGAEVAPRFDLATEVAFISQDPEAGRWSERIVVVPQPSAERLCHMILSEDVKTLVCGAIEEEYYQYLVWKRVTVIDSVMGPWAAAADRLMAGDLASGAMLFCRKESANGD